MIETNRLSHSDIKKLDHFTKVTHYLLMSQLSIFQQKAEREIIALLNNFECLDLPSVLMDEGLASDHNSPLNCQRQQQERHS